MSDVQTTNTNPPSTTVEENKKDSTLLARRLLVLAISFGLGGLISAIIMLTVLKVELTVTLPISNYFIPLLPLVSIPVGFFVMIWVDYFFGTGLVQD